MSFVLAAKDLALFVITHSAINLSFSQDLLTPSHTEIIVPVGVTGVTKVTRVNMSDQDLNCQIAGCSNLLKVVLRLRMFLFCVFRSK